jgi:hypothetical protein
MSDINVRDLVNDRIPRQVRFWDGDSYCTGIMVGKLLICGCCGGTFDLDEVIKMAREDGQVSVRVFDTWVDISDEIMGDETEAMGATPLFCEEEEK